MKLLVFHNPDAGHDAVPRDVLEDELQRAGHEVVWIDKGSDELDHALAQPLDAVVVAGGDGSIGAIGRMIVGRGLPMAVLPAGTANNIAGILGATRSNLLEQLRRRDTRPFDVGIVEGAGPSTRFFEGVGFGAFAQAAAILSAHGDGVLAAEGREEELARDRRMLRACVDRIAPVEYRVEADGETVAGTWLLLEVTNAGVVGPNLRLSPDAAPADGLLDIVTVEAFRRDDLLGFIAAHPRPPVGAAPFVVRRARQVRIEGPAGRPFHIDGDTITPSDPVDLRIGIEPAALLFLVP